MITTHDDNDDDDSDGFIFSNKLSPLLKQQGLMVVDNTNDQQNESQKSKLMILILILEYLQIRYSVL